jgi:ribosome biogenesis protein MAK21
MVERKIDDKPARRRGRKDGKDGGVHSIKSAASWSGSDSQHKLIITLTETEPTWFAIGNQQAERNATVLTNPPKASQKMFPALVNKCRRQADELYQKELFAYSKGHAKSSDDRWVEGTMKKGTLKDRIAAMSVVVSTDPVHKFYALDGLLQMAGCSEQKANSRVAQLASEALEDLFLNSLLPDDRKLMTLAQRPLYLYESGGEGTKQSSKTLSPRILLLWRFEEMVKEKYQVFLRQCMAKTLNDGLEMDKIVALRSASSLLRSVPEGESVLLELIVNKLGDPSKKVAAAAGHELRQVLRRHPAMQIIIAREVQQLAFRPGLKSRALYHCITFLNQLKLQREGPDSPKIGKLTVAASLISSYFRLFDVVVNEQRFNKEHSDDPGMKSRLLSALLSGVNRAHPYLPEKDKNLDEHMDSLYRVVHTAPPAACTQALLLLFHVVIGSKVDSPMSKIAELATSEEGSKQQERFYRALYSTLSNLSLLSSGKHLTMLFNLLYKAMKYDKDTNRVLAFGKRLLCTTVHCSSPLIAASIYLLNEIASYHPIVLSCFQDRLEEPDSRRILDPTKREPHGALIVEGIDDPESRVRKAPLWEFALTKYHFHPSVGKFTGSLGAIDYNGDPLRDFSLVPFLDKFAYRNPKSAEKVSGKYKRGDSVGERRSGRDIIIESLIAPPVNDPQFLRQQNVDAHDEFFHRFFVERSKRDKLKGATKEELVDDDEAEEDALHREETFDLGQRFEDFENTWDSDSDEEAFVDELAQQIIEDAIETHGPDELDDEDPNMADWDDMYDDDNMEEKRVIKARIAPEFSQDDEEDDDASSVGVDSDSQDDVDNFMDDSDGDSDDAAPHFLDDDDMDNSVQEEDMAFLVAPDDDDDDEERDEVIKAKLKNAPIFADVEEYEEMINSSLANRYREHEESEGQSKDSEKGKKKKSKKRKR